MKLPKKNVIRITEDKLPEPFKAYWEGRVTEHLPLKRNYEFFLVDGELYLRENGKGEELLNHWTRSSCCGICCYVHYLEKQVKIKKMYDVVRENGEYLFSLEYGEYELSAISPIDGESFTVYDG